MGASEQTIREPKRNLLPPVRIVVDGIDASDWPSKFGIDSRGRGFHSRPVAVTSGMSARSFNDNEKSTIASAFDRHSIGMQSNLCSGRIVGPVPYVQTGGKWANIPLGPCLVDPIDEQSVDVIWGASGQRSAVLSIRDLQAATSSGHLVLLGAVT